MGAERADEKGARRARHALADQGQGPTPFVASDVGHPPKRGLERLYQRAPRGDASVGDAGAFQHHLRTGRMGAS